MMQVHEELLALTRRLLQAIEAHDWPGYVELCDPGLSAFEPEAEGHLVEGLDFHRFYLSQPPSDLPRQTTLASPHVRLLGQDAAVVSYTRLVQRADEQGRFSTCAFNETRVWQRQDGPWKHVHFHRSACR